jgi:hypothetical protein
MRRIEESSSANAEPPVDVCEVARLWPSEEGAERDEVEDEEEHPASAANAAPAVTAPTHLRAQFMTVPVH